MIEGKIEMFCFNSLHYTWLVKACFWQFQLNMASYKSQYWPLTHFEMAATKMEGHNFIANDA